jgi:gentisate 1,2-dioxygenase
MAMFELGPGRGQSMHRHAGEAWLYVLEGTGHSYLGIEPEGGTDYPWKKGDLIVVDHFLWHQHFNDDPEKTAKVVRIHM